MPPKAAETKKAAVKPAATTKAGKSAPAKKVEKSGHVLWGAKPKAKGIGNGLGAKRDLTRFVRWPRYVKLQRQRRVLYSRLKVPPAINQFTQAADKNVSKSLFNLLKKYRPETSAEKKTRLTAAAQAGGKDPKKDGKKPVFIKCGLNHVTTLIENKKAKLVVIAHDVDPIELVIHLPTLCRKLDIPYLIVKGKARLGAVVHKKTASSLAFTDLRPEDASAFASLAQTARDQFNNNNDVRRTWGGQKLGAKSVAVIQKRHKLAAKEAARKAIKKEEKEPAGPQSSKAKAKDAKKAKAKAEAAAI